MKVTRAALIAVVMACGPTASRAQTADVASGTEAPRQAVAAAPRAVEGTREVASLRQAQEAALVPDPAAPVSTRHWGFRTLFRSVGSDFGHVPSRHNFAIAAVGGAAALALHPLDDDVNGRLQGTSFFDAGSRLGNTFTMMGATFAVYGLALATGQHHATHVALDVVRAQIVSETLVFGMKVAVRRERPDGSNRLSFPSGHTAVTFATASVIQAHHGWKWALPAYGLAAYVGTSRLHDNVHYLSDVAFGAAMGMLAGRTITRHGASTYELAPMFVRGGGGLMLMKTPGH